MTPMGHDHVATSTAPTPIFSYFYTSPHIHTFSPRCGNIISSSDGSPADDLSQSTDDSDPHILHTAHLPRGCPSPHIFSVKFAGPSTLWKRCFEDDPVDLVDDFPKVGMTLRQAREDPLKTGLFSGCPGLRPGQNGQKGAVSRTDQICLVQQKAQIVPKSGQIW
jgi:hypothetical protein